LAKVWNAAQARQWARGTKLVQEGRRTNFVQLVLKGSLKLTAAGREGSAIALKLAREGDIIGEASALAHAPSPFTATAMTKSEGLSWTAAVFERLAQDIRQLPLNSIALAVSAEQLLIGRICASSTEKVEERIARSLVQLVTAGIESDAGELLRVGGREIAELSDTTVYTVSRVISAWKRAGIVAGGRGCVTVLDLSKLAQLAGVKGPKA
jgi:CRP-like cAMP-binding protein